MVLKTSASFNHLTRLIAREDFIIGLRNVFFGVWTEYLNSASASQLRLLSKDRSLKTC